jgi:RNA polymerase primary sigma factor
MKREGGIVTNLKDIQQVKALIAKGKAAGYLTVEEVSKSVPAEMSSPENFEEIIALFDQLDIAIVDSEKEGKSIAVNHADAENEPVDMVFDGTDDDSLEFPLDLSAEDSGDFAVAGIYPRRRVRTLILIVPLFHKPPFDKALARWWALCRVCGSHKNFSFSPKPIDSGALKC